MTGRVLLESRLTVTKVHNLSSRLKKIRTVQLSILSITNATQTFNAQGSQSQANNTVRPTSNLGQFFRIARGGGGKY